MKLISGLLLASASLLIACDPGYSYHPDNWQPLEPGHSWKRSLNGIEANIYSMGGLVGSNSVVITLKLTNRTSRQLVLEGADLIVRDRQPFSAKLPGYGALRWRTVNPNQSELVELDWDFDQPAVDVLGEDPQVIVYLRHGDQAERVQIMYSRVE